MKKIGTIIIVLAAALYSSANNIGYIVSVAKESAAESYYFKTQDVEKVEKSIHTTTGLELNVEDILTGNTVFFEYRISGLRYYVEKKKIKRKKKGKIVYRKISKKELKEFALK